MKLASIEHRTRKLCSNEGYERVSWKRSELLARSWNIGTLWSYVYVYVNLGKQDKGLRSAPSSDPLPTISSYSSSPWSSCSPPHSFLPFVLLLHLHLSCRFYRSLREPRINSWSCDVRVKQGKSIPPRPVRFHAGSCHNPVAIAMYRSPNITVQFTGM